MVEALEAADEVGSAAGAKATVGVARATAARAAAATATVVEAMVMEAGMG